MARMTGTAGMAGMTGMTGMTRMIGNNLYDDLLEGQDIHTHNENDER
jgi:hypothetical protein